jgi:cell wall assembly regulator SMI1
MKDISAALNRINLWLTSSGGEFAFNGGASSGEISELETEIGLSLPDDLKHYLSIYDGEAHISDGIIGNWKLLGHRLISKCFYQQNALLRDGNFGDNTNKSTPYVKGYWWNPKWIPIVSSESGHYHCIDLDPNNEGELGQIILFLHDGDSRFLIARTLSEWFLKIADDLDKGKYKLVDDNGYLIFNNEAFMWSSIEGKDLYD